MTTHTWAQGWIEQSDLFISGTGGYHAKCLHAGPSAYSDLAIGPDMTIYCLYERGENHPYEKLTLAHFSLEWLTDGQDRV